MATSTYQTYLMHSDNGTDYDKLIDIKDFSDLGGTPEMLETTTLSDPMQTFTSGIQSFDAMTFTANYDKAAYVELKTHEGNDENYAVWFGGTRASGVETPVGDLGKFKFKGRLSVFVPGGGVNEVRQMTISIAPSTPVEIVD